MCVNNQILYRLLMFLVSNFGKSLIIFGVFYIFLRYNQYITTSLFLLMIVVTDNTTNKSFMKLYEIWFYSYFSLDKMNEEILTLNYRDLITYNFVSFKIKMKECVNNFKKWFASFSFLPSSIDFVYHIQHARHFDLSQP